MWKSKGKKNQLQGSGILVVVLSAMAFSIYAMSTFAEGEHFSILVDKYEKNNKEYYEKYVNEADDFYEMIMIKNYEKENR